MTPETVSLAALNVPLLEAIKAAPPTGTVELANRAGLVHNNISRKLDSLLTAGLISRQNGAATWDVTLTEAGETALDRLARWDIGPGAATDLVYIPENRLVRWADNPRTEAAWDTPADEDLTLSVADRGVETPVTVRAKGEDFEVIHGDRRRRAAQTGVARGLAAPGFLVPCRLRQLSDDEAYISAGVENIQREDMHWMDEARWLLGLASRGRSAPEIERIAGGRRKKRSIQDYIKCARELSPADIAKTYLPEKLEVGTPRERPNPDCLLYAKARDLVGEKKERPALELSAKAARALVEVIHRGLEDSGVMDLPKVGTTVTTMMWSAPSGGPLNTISLERKLTTFGFENRNCVARTVITETIHAWLTQIGFADDREAALFKVRAVELTELQAGTYGPGAYVTPELNEPERAASPPPAPMIQGGDGADVDADDDADIPPFLRRLAGDYSEPQSAAQPAGPTPQRMVEAPPTGAAAASPPPPPPAPIAPAPLPAMLEIIVVELAHKMGAATLKSPAGGFGAPVLADYYKDNRIGQLVQGWKLLGVHPAGEKTLAIQTDAARAFLVEDYGLEEIDGRVTLDDAVLEQAQMRLLGVKPSPGPYSTPWLNPPPKAETPAVEPEAAPLAPPSAEAEEEFDRIGRLAGEARAIASLASAARTAAGLLTNLKSRSKAPKAEDVDPTIRLIEAALEACAPLLSKEEI